MHRTQAADPQHGHAQRSEEEWDDDTQNANGPGCQMVQQPPGDAGHAEPLAQTGDDRYGENDERPSGATIAASRPGRLDRLRGLLLRGAPAGAPRAGAGGG